MASDAVIGGFSGHNPERVVRGGYNFKADINSAGVMEVTVSVAGKQIAEFQFVDDASGHEGELYPMLAEVEPAYQRQGIATLAYSWAEELTGLDMVPSQDQTPAARKFWMNRTKSRAESLLDRLGEARTAPLYHFVDSFWAFDQITLLGKPLKAHSLMNRPKEYGVSLTRDPALPAEGVGLWQNWGPIRLTFDQAKLGRRFKLEPYNYFADKPRDPAHPDRGHPESEELLLTGKAGLPDFWKYVDRVEVLKPEVAGPSGSVAVLMGKAIDMERLNQDLAALDKLGVPWEFVKSFSRRPK